MFESDAKLFFEAETYVLDAVKKFENTKTLVDTIKTQMNDIKYDTSYLTNNQDKINNVNEKLNGLVEKIKEVRENLIKIDQTFETEYSDILTNYSIDDVSKFDNSSFVLEDTELDFCELTDLQYNRLSMVSYYFSNWTERFAENKGKRLSEIELLFSDASFSQYGLGDFVVYDVINDAFENALMLILVDDMGNYTLVFPCTGSPGDLKNTGKDFLQQYEDSVYDVEIFLGLDVLTVPAEKKLVAQYTEEYYEKALSEGKKINFLGYSKGGGVAEYAYLHIAKELSEDERETLGEIIVYNPLHDRLTDEEVILLKEFGDFTVYRNQGDLVSTYNHENTFDDETIFIYCDWASKFEVTNDANRLSGLERTGIAALGILDFDIDFSGTDMIDVAMLYKNMDYVSYAFSGAAHSLEKYDERLSFDDYGNSIYNPKSYLYTESGKYTGREVSMYIWGIEDVTEVLEEAIDFIN